MSQSSQILCDYVTIFEAEEFINDGLNQTVVEQAVEEKIVDTVRYKLLFVLDYKFDIFVKS